MIQYTQILNLGTVPFCFFKTHSNGIVPIILYTGFGKHAPQFYLHFYITENIDGVISPFVLVALTFVFISSKLQYSTVAASRKYYKDIFELLVFPSL